MPVQVIQSPDRSPPKNYLTLFLSGTCSSNKWREALIDKLANLDITFYNPYRDTWENTDAFLQPQIAWEWEYLRKAKAIVCWLEGIGFSSISLFELGAAPQRHFPVWLGMDYAFPPRKNIEIQWRVMKPGRPVYYEINDLAAAIATDYKKWTTPPYEIGSSIMDLWRYKR